MRPLSLFSEVCALPWREGKLRFGLLLAAGATALLSPRVVAAEAAKPSLSPQDATPAGPAREKAQTKREKILFYAEAARQSLLDSKGVNEGEMASGAAITKYALWDGVACLQAQGGDFQAALATAAAHVRPQEDDGYVYAMIAIQQARAGDIAGAKESVKHVKMSVLNSLYWAQGEIALAGARTGDWQDAMAMLASTGSRDEEAPIVGLYDAFLDGVLAGNVQDKALLDQYLTMVPADKVDAIWNFDQLFTLQAVGQARANQFDKARSALPKVEIGPRKVWILRNIALQQARTGDTDGARKTLEPARGLLQENFALVDKEGVDNQTAEDYRRIELLEHLAATQVRVGDLEGARQTIEPIKKFKENARYEIELGELAAAQVEGVFPAEQRPTARESRLTIENLILGIRYEDQRAEAWGYVAHAQLQHGDTEHARQSVRRGVDLLQAAKEDEFLMAYSGRSLTQALAELGDLTEAVRVANLVQIYQKDFRSIYGTEQIARVVARQLDTKQAQSWVEQQTTDPYTRAMYYVPMGTALTGLDTLPPDIDTEDE